MQKGGLVLPSCGEERKTARWRRGGGGEGGEGRGGGGGVKKEGEKEEG